jgi:hypothetical protein
MTTRKLRVRIAAATVLPAFVLMSAVSCSSDQKSDSAAATPSQEQQQPAAAAAKQRSTKKSRSGLATMTVDTTPGEAGGVVTETASASATVLDVDTTSRRVMLQREDGKPVTFTAPREVRNLEQLKAGDQVKATVVSKLTVFIDQRGPSAPAQVAMMARAPRGEKPGALVAEAYEIVSTIKSIDPAARKAVLEFSDGQTETVPVREDVDLARYKPGDNVVIQVTQQLTVLTESR